LTQLIGWR